MLLLMVDVLLFGDDSKSVMLAIECVFCTGEDVDCIVSVATDDLVLPRAKLRPMTDDGRLEYTISTFSKSAFLSVRICVVASRQGDTKFSTE